MEMKTASIPMVMISLDEYNQLIEFRKRIEGGEVYNYCWNLNHTVGQHSAFLSNDDAVKELTAINRAMFNDFKYRHTLILQKYGCLISFFDKLKLLNKKEYDRIRKTLTTGENDVCKFMHKRHKISEKDAMYIKLFETEIDRIEREVMFNRHRLENWREATR